MRDVTVPIPGGAVQVKSGSVSRTSLCRETAAVVSFPRVVRNPTMINDGAFDGLVSAPPLLPSMVGCVQPRLRFADAARWNVAGPKAAARAAVPILLSPLASSYSKIILYVLAVSATSAPSLLLPAGGGVWGRAAPRTFAGAMAMKGASAAATRWAPSLFVCEPVGLTAHYVAAQRLPGDSLAADAAACTNWLAVCLVSLGRSACS